jgi:ferredoxin-NADP reductase
MALQPWRKAIVTRIENETPVTRRFWIQVPELNSFDFTPGQFVTIDLPIHEKANKRWRSYSIASWPDGTNVFELIIVLLEDGAGTSYLFNEVKEGTELTIRGPQGVFVLPDKIDKDLFFICTGTGIAPFRSMTHHILNSKIPHQHIYLIFGCRKISDALYSHELRELEQKVDSFHYLPVFSREIAENNGHPVRTGYVHSVYEEICRENSQPTNTGIELKQATFYLCGWKNMVDEAKQRIQALGYDKKLIRLELYG